LGNIDELTKTWEKSASLIRRKKDDARRKRQEENEEHNDDLFNNNEISYAEMNQLEEEFKQKEGELKAQEHKDEYRSYVEAVFDPVYDGLQVDIKALMDLYVEAEYLLHTSVCGVKSLQETDAPSTTDCLELLKDMHEQIEKRHEKVVQSVAERDRRYKKTETQPLYTSHNITQLKTVEKHFENAEKQAVLKAKREKAERTGERVNLALEVVVDVVKTEQIEMDSIIAAIKALDDGATDPDLLTLACDTLTALKLSSKTLLSLLNALEIDLNNTVTDAELAQAKSENADAGRLQELEKDKRDGAKKITEEFERRVGVLEQDEGDIADLVQKKKKKKGKGTGEEAKGREDLERDKRLRMALEEAKRRNGDA
jgi:hypothetical protein